MDKPQKGGKYTGPTSGRSSGGRSSSKDSSGDAQAEYADATTATEVDPSGGSGAIGELATTTTPGELTGFSDQRGGVRQFLDLLSGKESTASRLNNALALNRDALSTGQTNALALQRDMQKGQLTNSTTTARLGQTIAEETKKADTSRRAAKFNFTEEQAQEASSQGFNLNDEGGRADFGDFSVAKANNDYASMRKIKEDNAAKNAMTASAAGVLTDDFPGVSKNRVAPLNAESTLRGTTASVGQARLNPYLTQLNISGSDAANAALRGNMAPDALAIGNAAKANTRFVQPNEVSFTDEFKGVFPSNRTSGSVPARVDPITNKDIPGTGKLASSVDDSKAKAALDAAREVAANNPRVIANSTAVTAPMVAPTSNPNEPTGLFRNLDSKAKTVWGSTAGLRDTMRAISDLISMPAENSEEYKNLQNERQAKDNANYGISTSTPVDYTDIQKRRLLLPDEVRTPNGSILNKRTGAIRRPY